MAGKLEGKTVVVPLWPVSGLDVARALAADGASVVLVAEGESLGRAGRFASEMEGKGRRVAVFDAGPGGEGPEGGDVPGLAEFVAELSWARPSQ
jgi:hypothetical protein